MAKRPKVTLNPVADRHHGPTERIIEVSSVGGGCLIHLYTMPDANGREHLHVGVYRADGTVKVNRTVYEDRAMWPTERGK